MKEVFKYAISTPFLGVVVGREVGGEILQSSTKALRGVPNEVGVIEGVVSGSGLQGLETGRIVELGYLKTSCVHVTESSERSHWVRLMVSGPLYPFSS